jgi:hypothetical protein
VLEDLTDVAVLLLVCFFALSMWLYETTRRRLGLGTDVLQFRREIAERVRAEKAMRPADWQRPLRTLPSQILWLCITISGLLMGLLSGGMAAAAMRSGRLYWASRYTGRNGYIYRTAHTETFWVFIGIEGLFSIVILACTINSLHDVVREDRRRQSTFAEKCVLWGSGLIYFGGMASIGWYLAT